MKRRIEVGGGNFTNSLYKPFLVGTRTQNPTGGVRGKGNLGQKDAARCLIKKA